MLIDIDSKLVKMNISIVNFKDRSIPENVVSYLKSYQCDLIENGVRYSVQNKTSLLCLRWVKNVLFN